MWYSDRFWCDEGKSSSSLMVLFQNWRRCESLKFGFCQKIEILAEVEEGEWKVPKNGGVIYLGRLGETKEKSCFSFMVYFQNWWRCNTLKFGFCQKIKILAKLKKEIKIFVKLWKNVIFWWILVWQIKSVLFIDGLFSK